MFVLFTFTSAISASCNAADLISIYPVAKHSIKQKVWGKSAKLGRKRKVIVQLVGYLKSILGK